MKVWMALGERPYRFPIAMADSAPELARVTGAKVETIRSIAARVKSGKWKDGKYVCVEIGDLDE